MREDLGSLSERLKNHGFTENDNGATGTVDEEVDGFNFGSIGLLGRRQICGRLCKHHGWTSTSRPCYVTMLEPILRIVSSQAGSAVLQAPSRGDRIGEDHEVDDNGANFD